MAADTSQSFLSDLEQFYRSNFDYNKLISASNEVVQKTREEFITRILKITGDSNPNLEKKESLNNLRIKIALNVIGKFELKKDIQVQNRTSCKQMAIDIWYLVNSIVDNRLNNETFDAKARYSEVAAKKKSPNFIVGCQKSACNSSAVRPPKLFDYYAGVWSLKSSKESVKQEIEKFAKVETIMELNTKHDYYKSYHFQVSSSYKNQVLNSENWPEVNTEQADNEFIQREGGVTRSPFKGGFGRGSSVSKSKTTKPFKRGIIRNRENISDETSDEELGNYVSKKQDNGNNGQYDDKVNETSQNVNSNNFEIQNTQGDKILDNCDILFLCEHWLYKEEDFLIKSRYPNHNLYFQSDMDLALSDKKKGRRFG
ncbi:unnamed protein product, partial [Brachionus calyciflorus]